MEKPIVVADSGLLSKENIESLEQENYQYILGARIKNEATVIKKRILETKFIDGQIKSIKKNDASRIIINYSDKRARKDAHSRERGLKRLEKKIKSGGF